MIVGDSVASGSSLSKSQLGGVTFDTWVVGSDVIGGDSVATSGSCSSSGSPLSTSSSAFNSETNGGGGQIEVGFGGGSGSGRRRGALFGFHFRVGTFGHFGGGRPFHGGCSGRAAETAAVDGVGGDLLNGGNGGRPFHGMVGGGGGAAEAAIDEAGWTRRGMTFSFGGGDPTQCRVAFQAGMVDDVDAMRCLFDGRAISSVA